VLLSRADYLGIPLHRRFEMIDDKDDVIYGA
jgi:hypothetical protein